MEGGGAHTRTPHAIVMHGCITFLMNDGDDDTYVHSVQGQKNNNIRMHGCTGKLVGNKTDKRRKRNGIMKVI